jgi:hypothetical protein
MGEPTHVMSEPWLAALVENINTRQVRPKEKRRPG